jgi:hypothetical protein
MLPVQPTICFKLASRSRPEKCFNSIHNINAMVGHKNYFILVSLDIADPTMDKDDVRGWFHEHPECIPIWGEHKSKISAINRDMSFVTDWDILINTSDDMKFIVNDFGKIIIDHMRQYHPEGDGILHYPDGNEPGTRVMTLSIMGRRYYDRFGYIYHPDYTSLWCDVEATDVAKKLEKYIYINQQLFDHLHPAHRPVPMDEQYKHTESYFYQDNAVYERRKMMNFGL